MDTELQNIDKSIVKVMSALKKVEGGDYNNRTGDGGTSAGAYQWNNGKVKLKENEIPVNFRNMAKNNKLNPDDFSPANQNKVAYYQIKKWKDSGLEPEEIAALWNGAKKDKTTGKYTYVNPEYGERFRSAIRGTDQGYNPKPYTQPESGVIYPEVTGTQREELMAQGQPVSVNPEKAQPTFAGSIVRGILKPFAQVGTSLVNMEQLVRGKELTHPFSGGYLGNVERVGEGFDVSKGFTKENVSALKKSAGTGIEIGSNFVGGGGAKTAVEIAKTGLKFGEPIVKQAATGFGQGLKLGFISGVGYGLSEDKNLADTAVSGLTGALGGGVLGTVLGTVGGVISKAKGITPETEKVARETFEKEYVDSLSRTVSGRKILAETERGRQEALQAGIYPDIKNGRFDSTEAMNKLQKQMDRLGESRGTDIASQNRPIDVATLGNTIKQNVDEFVGDSLEKQKINKVVDEWLGALEQNVDLNNLNKKQVAAGQLARFQGSSDATVRRAYRSIYHGIGNYINNEVKDAGGIYKEINDNLSRYHGVMDFLESINGKKVGSNKLVDMLSGHFTNTVGAGIGGVKGILFNEAMPLIKRSLKTILGNDTSTYTKVMNAIQAGEQAKIDAILEQVSKNKGNAVANNIRRLLQETPQLNAPTPGAPKVQINTPINLPAKSTTSLEKAEIKAIQSKKKGLFDIMKNEGEAGFANMFSQKGLTTKILKDLEGKTTVSKQYILDATNRPELKQVERDLIRDIASREGDTINVSDFAKKIKAELLPLNVKTTSNPKGSDPKFFREQTMNDAQFGGARMQPRYEMVTLPDELRGDVGNYRENIYESPIKTSAGKIHFGGKTDNYFGHTRIEDMADNKTRRVIEVQSDLYQKGNLEKEFDRAGRIEGSMANKPLTKELAQETLDKYQTALNRWREGKRKMSELSDDPYFYADSEEMLVKRVDDWKKLLAEAKSGKIDARKAELSKLQQYNDPTAHFRMVREEIKKAAEDGKTKLQFPTGETAMKIEGLGSQSDWVAVDFSQYNTPQRIVNRTTLTPDILKVGMDIQQGGITGGGQKWIITDVLGDGKFKAVPKNFVDEIKAFDEASQRRLAQGIDTPEAAARLRAQLAPREETFDISGKVDTSNPIYKFYEKDIAKYLNKFGGKRIVDDKGVSWIEVPITKQMGGDVEAFGFAQLGMIPKVAGVTALGTLGANIYNKKKKKGLLNSLGNNPR